MTNLNSPNTNNPFSNEEFDEIDLQKVLNFLLRHKLKILVTSFGITFLAILWTFTQKPIWQGNFKILVEKKEETNNNKPGIESVLPKYARDSNSTKTKERVLQSPYVLKKPYENFLKDTNNKKLNSLSFEEWKNKHLNIRFIKDTKILVVKFKDHNKDLIISTLNDISNTYEEYSKKDKIKSIKKSVNFLESQSKILQDKSLLSLKELNNFSLRNRLGDIDGFVEFTTSNSEINTLNNLIEFQGNSFDIKDLGSNNKISNSGSGQRFASQLQMLERYESTLLYLSSKLKPESKLISDYKNKIKTISSELKRPNKILVDYRNLKRKAIRDLNILRDVELRLSRMKFEQAKRDDPWSVISNPIIEASRVYPRRSETAIISLFFSFIASSIFFYYKEKNTGILYEIDTINKKIDFDFLGKIYYKSFKLNDLIIKNSIESLNKNISKSSDEICLIVNRNNFLETKEINNYFQTDFKIFDINSISEKTLNSYQYIFVILEEGKTNTKDLIILNEFRLKDKEKILGWISTTKSFLI